MTICDMRYKKYSGDHTLFYKHFERHITILAVYVDNVVITEDDEEEIL
jgi:hypothetical protein